MTCLPVLPVRRCVLSLLLAALVAASLAQPGRAAPAPAALGAGARGGVLFYAGFEGTANAGVALGDATAQVEGTGPHFAGGKRGQALRAGRSLGWVSYAAPGNLLPQRGSIELWYCADGWQPSEEHHHVFFEASAPGWLVLYKYYQGSDLFWLTSERQASWTVARTDLTRARAGEWHQLVGTWDRLGTRLYLDGRQVDHQDRAQIPVDLGGRFRVGDRTWQDNAPTPGAAPGDTTLVDELYIYGRALNDREVAWAYQHAADRPAGGDVPDGLISPARVIVRPLPFHHRVDAAVYVDPRLAGRGLSGWARLVPAGGTRPARLRRVADDEARGSLRFGTLPPGRYRVEAVFAGPKGEKQRAASAPFTVPAPPTWLGNRIGIPTVPPPPWTPVVAKGPTGAAVSCWGRAYRFGANGLPAQVTSAGADLLSAPVALRASSGGQAVAWRPGGERLAVRTPVQAQAKGQASSVVGTLSWTRTVEFDGMARFDLILYPRPGPPWTPSICASRSSRRTPA